MFTLRSKLIFVILIYQLMVPVWAELLPYSNDLKQSLSAALNSQAVNYSPRTEHMCDNDTPCYTNRLILESSPYLLQHAHNPVDWHVWGKEALDRAKRENKPIFLSVGYAACHWCHVMEKESFDNVEIARILNKYFIPIKVDRERRPDIDEFYGNAMVYFVGQQGWPMSLFLTPEGKPFDGGGYYPFIKFKALLHENAELWKDHFQQAMQDAEKVMSRIRTGTKINAGANKLDDVLRKRAIKDLLSIVDNYNGGFGEGNKFPRETWLSLLLDDSYGKSKNNNSLVALNNTLTHIGRGGIYDQLGGGFHRYATDPYWKVPHFEKMLYNQALLIRIYLHANVIKPDVVYTRLAKQTADFLLSEMRDLKGGFYSALDADTEGKEGYFYLWHLNEWQQVLNKSDSQLFAELYDVDEYGETVDGRNVLYLFSSYKEFADDKKVNLEKIIKDTDRVRHKLLEVRNKRTRPARDEKIIMGWNGLAITALAESSLYLNKSEYLDAAVKAANFIWNKMQQETGFFRIYFNEKNSKSAQLEDYAFYLQALVTLYDIEKNEIWLQRAKTLVDKMTLIFWDKKNGAFYNTPIDEDGPLPFRPKSAFDKTLPSGNSVTAHMLIRLARRTGEEKYKQMANEIFSVFAAEAIEVPSAFSGLLIASNELHNGEMDLPVYGARGHIRIDANINQLTKKSTEDNSYELTIDMKFDDAWHINSHTPFDKLLIPTSIKLREGSIWALGDIEYPRHEVVKLGFSKRPLALYQEQVKIKAKLKKGSTALNPGIKLHLQACNDEVCLPPENLVLYPRLIIKNQ